MDQVLNHLVSDVSRGQVLLPDRLHLSISNAIELQLLAAIGHAIWI